MSTRAIARVEPLGAIDRPARMTARQAAAARARSWTGRATVTLATDSHLSRIATAGTFRTRVSAMRDDAAAHVAAGSIPFERRGLAHRRSGHPGSG
jgi:hypothetical protein